MLMQIYEDRKQVRSRELDNLILPTTSTLTSTAAEEAWGESL